MNKIKTKVLGMTEEQLVEKAFSLIALWLLMPFAQMILNLLFGYLIDYVFILFVYAFGIAGIIIGLLYLKILNRGYEKSTDWKKKAIDILPLTLLAVFLIWAFICAVVSRDSLFISFIGYPLKKEGFFTYIAFAGFLLSGVVAARNRDNIIRLANLFIIVTCVLSIITMLYAWAQKVSTGEYSTECFRSVYHNSNHFGYVLTLANLTWFYMVLNRPKLGKGYFIQMLQGFILISELILNNTLGSYLAVVVCMIFTLIWKIINGEKDKGRTLAYMGFFLFVTFASFTFTKNVYNNFAGLFGDIGVTEAFLAGEEELEEFGHVGSGRGILWKVGLQQALKSPIFGYGPDGLSARYVAEGMGERRAHNVFIHVLAYFGIPGFLLYMSTFIAGAKRLLKQRKTLDPVIKSAAFIVVGRMMSEFFGNPMYTTTPYFLIIFGICCSACLNGINERALLPVEESKE